MSWRPDQQTQESIEGMVDALFAVAPDVLGIDEFIAGCEVSNMDLYGVGVGVYPRYIQCDIKGYQQPVFYRGGLATLAVGDDVTVVHIRDGELYEVAGPSGATGVAGITGTGLNTQVTYWTGPNIIAGDAGMTYVAATDTLSVGVLEIPATTATLGQITQAGSRFIHTYGTDNLFVGEDAGNFTLTGQDLVGLGQNALTANTSGDFNIAIGSDTLQSNTTGSSNIAIGFGALETSITTDGNTAIGNSALQANTTGTPNVAIGKTALRDNTTGDSNVAVGSSALENNTIGNRNLGIGTFALLAHVDGADNVAIGTSSLLEVVSGAFNVAIGTDAGRRNTGNRNVFIGQSTGRNKQTGDHGVYIGFESGLGTVNNRGWNTFIGSQAGANITTADDSVMIGYRAGFNVTTADRNILIGLQAGDVLTTGGANIIIGFAVDPTGAAVSNQLNIGDLIYGDLSAHTAGINVTPPNLLATWHVDQLSTTAAIPVLYLDQADISEEMIEFNTTIGVGNAIEAVGGKTLTTTHFVKCTIPGPLTVYFPVGTIA